MAKLSRNQARIKKYNRLKSKITFGTATRPRVMVYKSLTNFYAQLVDDQNKKTITSVSTVKYTEYSGNVQAAEKLGLEMAKVLKNLKIDSIIFDRSGYVYHGKVKAFADALRKEGVKF